MSRPTLIPPEPLSKTLTRFLIAGVVIGALPLERSFFRAGLGVHYANLVAVNILLPLAVIVLALHHPRARRVWPGAVLATLGFVLARMLFRDWHIWTWNLPLLRASIHPILIPATLGYALLGSLAVLIARPVRRIGEPDHRPRCAACGYLLIDLPDPRCPECGTPAPDHAVSVPAGPGAPRSPAPAA